MRVLHNPRDVFGWRRLSERSVRLRLTVVYGSLFLVSGLGLLALTYVLVRVATAGGYVTVSTGSGVTPTGAPAMTATSHPIELNHLAVLSGIALAIMTIGSVEFGWLMAGRVLAGLEATFEAQRRFIANASHELRTPLTMMRTSLDVAVAKPEPIPPQVHALDAKLREGLDHADRLLESFLSLARAQQQAHEDDTTVSLTTILDEALSECHDAIADKDIEVRTSLDAVTVRGNATLLSLMVMNVIDNAVRHNECCGFIAVESELHGNAARLVVENGGAHLDDAVVGQLGQPFRRLDADRTGSVDGVGLGLSIVAAVAAAHGGSFELYARAEGGLRVEVELAGASLIREPTSVGS